MALLPLLPKPDKPLKILTFDGGGLQAISNLLILDKLLDTIAKNNKTAEKPRPCDVFDTIAGIGAGGWIALLLGRFHLDIPSCLTEWYHIMECITPNSKTEQLRKRVLHHCYYDVGILTKQIDRLTKIYGTTERMFYDPAEKAEELSARPRCQHVFVAALNEGCKDSKLGYKLFRTYPYPRGAKVREGPEDPDKYKISRAFAVTGAARYFTPPWVERMASSGPMKFRDTKFPKPHNITELAIDEMLGLYGRDVPLSVVVNIGPGLPNDSDIKHIARRFSWGLPTETFTKKVHSKRNVPAAPEDIGRIKKGPLPTPVADVALNTNTGAHVQFHDDTPDLKTSPKVILDTDRKRSLARTNTFGSIAGRGIDKKLKRLESEIEADIKDKLKNLYPDEPPPYYRLAPERSPLGTAQNDASTPSKALVATQNFLGSARVMTTMDDICERIPPEITAAA